MILDDGSDATLMLHKGVAYEEAGVVPNPGEADSDEWKVFLEVLRNSLADLPGKWTRVAEGIRGVTEETTTECTGCINWPQLGSYCSRRSMSTIR